MRRWLALAALALPLSAGAAGYELHLVSERPIGVDAVAINQAGIVAWEEESGGVFKGTPGGPITTIGTNGGVGTNRRVFIDDLGRVAYRGSGATFSGLFLGANAPADVLWADDGTYQGATEPNGGFEIVPIERFSVDHNGTFAFDGRFVLQPPAVPEPTDVNGLFAVPAFGGSYNHTRLVASTDDLYYFVNGLVLNGDTVVLSSDDGDAEQVIRFDGTNPTVIADSANGFEPGLHMTVDAINASGDVLFYGCSGALQCGLWVEPFAGPGIVAPLVFQEFTSPSSGSVATFGPYASLTDGGQIAYVGLSENSLDTLAIFTGPGPIANRVIGVGDSLFGNQVLLDGFTFGGMNDAGQIAFAASVDDAGDGHTRFQVVRADPVPEPDLQLEAGAASLALTTLCGVARRRAA